MSITGSAVLEARRRLRRELLAVATLGPAANIETALLIADAYAEAARADERTHFTAGRIGG